MRVVLLYTFICCVCTIQAFSGDSSSDTCSNRETFEKCCWQDEESYGISSDDERPRYRLSDNPDDIKFFLFPDEARPNINRTLVINNTESVQNSGLKSEKKIVLIIHGFLNNGTSPMPTVIKEAYLKSSLGYNIIIVDWGALSSPSPGGGGSDYLHYPSAQNRVPIAAKRVADFIQFLLREGFTLLQRIHMIGHSLGAHVAGGAGRIIKNDTANKNRLVSRISGLDPAGFRYDSSRREEMLNKTDARFVDVYHTERTLLGTAIRDEGHADFFPNGGYSQPGCGAIDVSCDHFFAVRLYAASISKNITACPCYLNNLKRCTMDCSNDVKVLAGQRCLSSTRGQFYIKTGSSP